MPKFMIIKALGVVPCIIGIYRCYIVAISGRMIDYISLTIASTISSTTAALFCYENINNVSNIFAVFFSKLIILLFSF
jgi:hypothetical protein